MLYKSIVLDLIQENPTLYEELRSSKRLLPALDVYAIELKASQEKWTAKLDESRPGSDPRQTGSEAMEMAIEELQNRLCSASPADETEPLSLDAAMNFLRKASSPA